MVKALGDSGFKELCERNPITGSLPRPAARTLPSCWRGGILLGLPMLGHEFGGEPSGIACQATFVSRGEDRGNGPSLKPLRKHAPL
jgi:hypothetical protein